MLKGKWFTGILLASALLIAVSAFGDERSFLKTSNDHYYPSSTYGTYDSPVAYRGRQQALTIDGTFEGFARGNRMVIRTRSGRQVIVYAPRGLKVYDNSAYYQSQRRRYGNRGYYGRQTGTYSRLNASDLRRGDPIRVVAISVRRSGLQAQSITLLSSPDRYDRGRRRPDRYYDQRQYDQRNRTRNDETWRRRAEDQRYRNDGRDYDRDRDDD